jgi:nicotinamide N-methyltransferase
MGRGSVEVDVHGGQLAKFAWTWEWRWKQAKRDVVKSPECFTNIPLLFFFRNEVSNLVAPSNSSGPLTLHPHSFPPSHSFTILASIGPIPPFSSPTSAMASMRRPPVFASSSSTPADRLLKSRFSDQSLVEIPKSRLTANKQPASHGSGIPKKDSGRPTSPGTPIINISLENNTTPIAHNHSSSTITHGLVDPPALADELDYITITAPVISSPNSLSSQRTDKASRILGIKHRRSMEPIPASARNSIVSTRSARDPPPMASFVPTLPLTSLYVVSGLPKSPHTWTLADPDSVLGLHHSDGAVSRWWRPEVLGSTVSPGAGGGKKKKRGKGEEIMKGAGALSKQEVGKMLSKALKVRISHLTVSQH